MTQFARHRGPCRIKMENQSPCFRTFEEEVQYESVVAKPRRVTAAIFQPLRIRASASSKQAVWQSDLISCCRQRRSHAAGAQQVEELVAVAVDAERV